MNLCRPASGRTCHVLALAALCVFAVAAGCPDARGDKPQKQHKENRRSESHQIESLEEQWRDALMTNNSAVIDKMTTDDLLAISSNGTLSDKGQYLKRIASRINQFSTFEMQVLKVRVQPGSAIATSEAHVIGTLDSRPVNAIFRYTKVYTRSPNGAWRVANFEVTRVSRGVNGDQGMVRGMPLAEAPTAPAAPAPH